MASHSPLFLLFAAGLILALSGCARRSIDQSAVPGAAADSAAVTGTVFYLERVALLPEAVVRIRLDDVSRADAPALTLAEQTIQAEGRQVPFSFVLTYDPAAIDARARYVVRAEIRDGEGTLLWASDSVHEVITQGALTEDVEVIVRRAVNGSDSGSSNGDGPDAGGMTPLPTGRILVYGCDAPGGEAFTFAVRPGPGEVGIELPERFGRRSLALPQVRAASGSRFEGDGVLFWVSGEHVRLDVEGQTFGPCAERPEGAAGQAAQDRGVAFRAVGREPGWTLEIISEQHVRFTYNLGKREVFAPVMDLAVDEATGRTTYYAVNEAHRLRVVIEDRACTDVMSGEAFETTVAVTLDGKTYHGCGRAL